MNKQTLINYIIDLYRSSKRTGMVTKNIKRGKQPAISSKVEDLFAHYLSSNFSHRWNYYLEYQVKSSSGQTTVPDITIVQQDKILSFFDLKMDIGFGRDEFKDFCLTCERWIESIKGSSVTLSYGSERFTCELPNNIKYNIVIVSKKNITEQKFSANIEQLKDLKNIQIYFLTSGEHPNSKIPYEDLRNKIEINDEDFNAIHKYLEQLYIENAIFFLNDEQIEKLEEVMHSSTFQSKYFEQNELEESSPNDYENRMDKIFGSYWNHRTLRTLFDPGSSEFTETNLDQKITYLKKIISSGEDLPNLLMNYKMRYYEQGRKDIADNANEGIALLLSGTLNVTSSEKTVAQ